METISTTWVALLRSSLGGILMMRGRLGPGSAVVARCLALTAGLLVVLAVAGVVAARNARCEHATCAHRMPDGHCRMTKRRCRLCEENRPAYAQATAWRGQKQSGPGRYVLRKGAGIWWLVFDGKEGEIGYGRGIESGCLPAVQPAARGHPRHTVGRGGVRSCRCRGGESWKRQRSRPAENPYGGPGM